MEQMSQWSPNGGVKLSSNRWTAVGLSGPDGPRFYTHSCYWYNTSIETSEYRRFSGSVTNSVANQPLSQSPDCNTTGA